MSGLLIYPSNYDIYGANISSPGQSGAAHSISGDMKELDSVELLRRAVEEVTRKTVPRETRKIGFY